MFFCGAGSQLRARPRTRLVSIFGLLTSVVWGTPSPATPPQVEERSFISQADVFFWEPELFASLAQKFISALLCFVSLGSPQTLDNFRPLQHF